LGYFLESLFDFLQIYSVDSKLEKIEIDSFRFGAKKLKSLVTCERETWLRRECMHSRAYSSGPQSCPFHSMATNPLRYKRLHGIGTNQLIHNATSVLFNPALVLHQLPFHDSTRTHSSVHNRVKFLLRFSTFFLISLATRELETRLAMIVPLYRGHPSNCLQLIEVSTIKLPAWKEKEQLHSLPSELWVS
jgi:hypothetical protein